MIRRVSRIYLCDIPMLHDTRPIEPIYICQRDRARVLVHTQVDEADFIVEIVPLHCELGERNDGRELGDIWVTALEVKRVVLNQVARNMIVKRLRNVLLNV